MNECSFQLKNMNKTWMFYVGLISNEWLDDVSEFLLSLNIGRCINTQRYITTTKKTDWSYLVVSPFLYVEFNLYVSIKQICMYRLFIKYCVFSIKFCDFSELCQFCCSAGVLLFVIDISTLLLLQFWHRVLIKYCFFFNFLWNLQDLLVIDLPSSRQTTKWKLMGTESKIYVKIFEHNI